jgi:hypothetical protein
MKQKYLFIIGLIIIFSCSQSIYNESFAQEFSVGIRGGANVSKISKMDIRSHFKPGFHFGFYTTYVPYGTNFSFTNELIFSMKGVSLTLPDSLLINEQSKYSKSLNYLDLPFLFNFHAGDALMLSAGFQPSLYLYFKEPKWNEIPFNKDNGAIIDLSLVLGAGLKINDEFVFGVRYNKSFVPAFASVAAGKGKTHLIQIFLAYELAQRKMRW